MKRLLKNIWAKLSSSQKMNLIGSVFLIFSLFLNWFSDTDIFRSGDTYTGLTGPVYLVGITLLTMAAGNILMTFLMAMKAPFVKGFGEIKLGQWQMNFGFLAMYLLVLTNSVYFSPLFGLNILNKRSEIGVMVALGAVVMICVGGYLAFRKKFEAMEAAVAVNEAAVPASAREKTMVVAASKEVEVEKPVAAPVRVAAPVSAVASVAASAPVQVEVSASESVPVASAANDYFSERDPRGKTDFERNKLYENLRKTMLRDTLTPQQRKKDRMKDVGESAFSAKFGQKTVSGAAAKTVGEMVAGSASAKSNEGAAVGASAKKPQMYRLDL